MDCKMFRLVRASSNRKTGPMAVSTSPSWTCPNSCPFRLHGCYGAYGKTLLWWNRLSKSRNGLENEYDRFLEEINGLPSGGYFRHNQAGDFVPSATNCNRISDIHANRLVESCKHLHGFAYTHYSVTNDCGVSESDARWNREVIRGMNCKHFAVNVSANSLSHVDKLVSMGIDLPITVVLPSEIKKMGKRVVHILNGIRVLVCPAVYGNIQCIGCGLCMDSKRKVVIGFPAHGRGMKHVDKIVMGLDKKEVEA